MSDDENGSCTLVDGYGYGDFGCLSVAPEEAAELEAVGQGTVIKIPKK